jgi:3-oxoacyl-[acyl-carrier-protein] synthase-3
LRFQSYTGIGSRDFRRWRQYHTPAAVGLGSGRYGRSFSFDPGAKQSAQPWASPVVGDSRRQWICGTSSGVALNINVRIAAAAYAVPPDDEAVEAVFEQERTRVETSLSPLSPESRRKAVEGLGLNRVRICGEKQLYDLVLEAASRAIAEAAIMARDINLILDFSTWSSEISQGLSFAHKLSADLGAETSMILSFKVGGCAGLHVAIKTALGWMATDESVRTVLLITGDAAPQGNRSLLPITMHGDAGSAVILRRDSGEGPTLLGVEALTLGHLHNAITMVRTNGRLDIVVDALCMEREVMPIYFLNMLVVVNKALAASSLSLNDIDHFIYSNISRRDREGFRKMLGLAKGSLPATPMAEYGHTFASDLVINYVTMRREGLIRPGQLLLFASAGIGFTWGVTLARA